MVFLGEKPLELESNLEDLKLIYKVLHSHLNEHLELMDSQLFMTLQDTLQHAARMEGVDVGDHAAWETWLSGGVANIFPSAVSDPGLLN